MLLPIPSSSSSFHDSCALSSHLVDACRRVLLSVSPVSVRPSLLWTEERRPLLLPQQPLRGSFRETRVSRFSCSSVPPSVYCSRARNSQCACVCCKQSSSGQRVWGDGGRHEEGEREWGAGSQRQQRQEDRSCVALEMRLTDQRAKRSRRMHVSRHASPTLDRRISSTT